jgi:hypothetical protein
MAEVWYPTESGYEITAEDRNDYEPELGDAKYSDEVPVGSNASHVALADDHRVALRVIGTSSLYFASPSSGS